MALSQHEPRSDTPPFGPPNGIGIAAYFVWSFIHDASEVA